MKNIRQREGQREAAKMLKYLGVDKAQLLSPCKR